jgi:iron complex outermembrane receptor protein
MLSSTIRRAWRLLLVSAVLGAVANVRPAAAADPGRDRAPATPLVLGEVRDPNGTPLPNVQVIVVEVSRTTTTNEQGRFTLAGLPAGVYHVNTILLGYAPQHTLLTLPAEGDTMRLAITMRPTTVRLQTVQVTATPTGTDPLNITQATVELSGKELGRNLGASVAQTLSAEPGMSQRFNGPAASAPVIRGLTGERIVVLQDGERAADLSSVSADHGITVDPLNAQRIEVVRGPASLLYGNNALGGVVNVISNDIPTNIPSHLEGYVGGQAESVNPGGATTASLTMPVGSRLAFGIRGGWRDMGDLRTGEGGRLLNTDSRNWNAVVGAGLVTEKATAGAAYRGYDFQYGIPSRPGAEEAGVRIDGRRHQLSGRGTFSLGGVGLTNVKVDGTAQWYTHDEIEPSGEVGTTFDLRTQTANATARTAFGRLAGALGVQGLFRQYDPEGEEALTPAANSDNGGVFLYQEYPLGVGTNEARTPRLQFGGRYDVFRVRAEDSENPAFGAGRTRTFRNVSGSFGASLPLGSTMSLSGSVARAFRAPTVEELYSNAFHAAVGTFDVGTPTLRAETNRGIDAVLRAQSGRTYAQFAAYYNRIDNYIAPEVDPLQPIAEVDNEEGGLDTVPRVRFIQRDASLRGVEGQVEWAVSRRWVLGAMGDIVRGRYESTRAALPFIPSARFGGSARWDDGRLFAGAEVRHGFGQERVTQPACGTAPIAADAGSCVDVPTPAYTLVNVNVGLNLIQGVFVHSLTLRLDNALDERWYDAASRIKAFAANPGRNVSVVYRVLF